MSENVILFHITFPSTLLGVIEEGGLTPSLCGPKIFVSLAMENLGWQGHNEELPVVLRLTIPLDEFTDFELYKDVNAEYPFKCWFFEKTIPIEYLEIATYDNPDFDENKNDQPICFKPLTDYNDDDNPLEWLVLLKQGVNLTDEFDMSYEFVQANHELFERVKEDD